MAQSVAVRTSNVMTRPADTTAYASADLVANSTTASEVVPLTISRAVNVQGGLGRIERVRLKKSAVSVTNAVFRIHFFTNTLTSAAGDNAAMAAGLPVAGYAGSFDVTVAQVFADASVGIGIPVNGTSGLFQCAATDSALYAVIEARGAYTPASGETFAITIEVTRY